MQASLPSARLRKGGYGDAGGLASNGELPEAPPLSVASEAELRDEVDRVGLALTRPSAEWVDRVNALLRLEGLAKGGAAERFDGFAEAVALLRDPLAKQLQERRSAVSRQACHVLSVLALASGPRIEGLAGQLLPSLFKAMAMSIQVVTDAADACARTILRHCQPRAALPKLAETAAQERQGRLRQCAAEYLLLILEEWDPLAYARHVPALEAAILSMAQDAQEETRATGRAAFAALAHTWPDSARSVLHRADRHVQERLERAAEDYVPCRPDARQLQLSRQASLDADSSGATTPTAAAPAQGGALGNAGRLGGALRVAPVPRLMLHSMAGQGAEAAAGPGAFSGFQSCRLTGVAATPAARVATGQHSARENSRPNAAAATNLASSFLSKGDACPGTAAPAQEERQAARERARGRKSMGGAALRIALASARDFEDEGSAPLQSAVRVARPAALSQDEGSARGGQDCEATEDGSLYGAEASGSYSGLWGEPSAPGVTVLQLLAGLARAGVDWREKMGLFQQLGAAASQAGGHGAGEIAANVERVSAALLDGIGDAHFKVATTALAALHSCLSGPCVRFFEPQLDRIVPALFARVADGKEQVRQLVAEALDPLPAQHPAEVVLAALGKALQSNKAPRVKCAVMDFYARWMSVRAPAEGGATDDGEERQLAGALSGQGLRALAAGILALATDKNPDIRRSAVAAAAAAYRGGDAGAVVAALHALPAEKMAAAQKALVAAVGAKDAMAAPPPTSRRAAPPPAAAPPKPAVEAPAAALPQPEPQAAPEPAALEQQPEPEASSQQPSTPTAPGAASADCGGSGRVGRLAPLAISALAASPKTSALSSPLSRTRSPVQFTPSSGKAAAAAPAVAATPEPPSPFVYWASNGTPMTIKVPARLDSSQAVASPAADGALAAQLRSLICRLGGDGDAAEVFSGLSRLAEVLPTSAWPGYFNQVVAAIAASSSSGSAQVREAALLLARDLAAAVEPALLAGPAADLLPHLLRCAGDEHRSVALAAEEALAALMGLADPTACLATLQKHLPQAGAPPPREAAAVAALRAALVGVRCAVARLAPSQLLPAAQQGLLPRLFAALDSPAAHVRKAAVDCLASAWVVLGDAMAPLLDPLSPAQLKLVALYRDRLRAAE